MKRKYSPITYWCVEITDSTGATLQRGYEATFSSIVLWSVQELENLPEGHTRMVEKSLKK